MATVMRASRSIPVLLRRALPSRPFSSTPLARQGSSGKSTHRLWLGTTSCLVGCALFGFTAMQESRADSNNTTPSNNNNTSTSAAAGAWGEWKKDVMTNYENRIRNLSSPEKIFAVFASVTKDGHTYMTVDDFMRALIPHEHGALVAESDQQQQQHQQQQRRGRGRDAHTHSALPAAFKLADQNQDGLISFEEYLFFVTLLSIPEQSFKVAFRMLDANSDGRVDQQEFTRLIGFLRAASPMNINTTTAHPARSASTSGIAQGWMAHYFGPSAGGLTLEAFTTFLQQLKSDVLRLEFNIYDPQEVGYVSQRDFGMLLLSYARSKHLPAYIKRAHALETTPLKLFTFEQFQNFNLLLEHIDEVETAMKLFQLNGRPFRKQDLSHLSKIVCGTDLNQQVIDTIMTIFDANNDGTLDLDEFVTVLKRRKQRGLSEPRDTGFFRKLEGIVKCIRQA